MKNEIQNLEFTGIKQLINPKSDKALKEAWKNSLGQQIQPDKLPDYEIVRDNLLDLYDNIFFVIEQIIIFKIKITRWV